MQKYLKYVAILAVVSVVSASTLLAQCVDFTDLESSSVCCTYGTVQNPFRYSGIDPTRHKVISEQGFDPFTGNILPLLPPHTASVVRIGNRDIGASAESITYTFTVDAETPVLLLNLAVVLEDPMHTPNQQPHFVVRVLDASSSGDANGGSRLIDPCAEYDVRAGASDAAGTVWETYADAWHTVRWLPWTPLAINLAPYVGRQVSVQFLTYDCTMGGHFGYAYFTGQCVSGDLSVRCENGNSIFSAPVGFESYRWMVNDSVLTAMDGESDLVWNTSYTPVGLIDGVYTVRCDVTSFTGCTFSLCGTVWTGADSETFEDFSPDVYDTICEGMAYCTALFNLPPQMSTGTHLFRTTQFAADGCSVLGVVTLHLTVLPTFEQFTDFACEGDDYNLHGFHLSNLATGIIYDTLVTHLPRGCITTQVLRLRVNSTFGIGDAIYGDTIVCEGSLYEFYVDSLEGTARMEWTTSEGVTMIGGGSGSRISALFGPEAANPATLVLYGENGCGSDSLQLRVWHNPSYTDYYVDTICVRNEYENHGFHTHRIDSLGYYGFYRRQRTVQGCDSNSVLTLVVAPNPQPFIRQEGEVFCAGGTTRLHAVTNDTANYATMQHLPVRVGDIMCADGTIVHPEEWVGHDCNPMAVVFYVDQTGEHGWAVHITEQSTSCIWSTQVSDVDSLVNYLTSRQVLRDTAGYRNTRVLRTTGTETTYPAAYLVDIADGWYLPTCGQLRVLYAALNTVNASLSLVGGTAVGSTSSSNWRYWASNEFDEGFAWSVASNGFLSYPQKSLAHRVRAVRSF